MWKENLNIKYNMIEFESYHIPDRLNIWPVLKASCCATNCKPAASFAGCAASWIVWRLDSHWV